MKEIRSKGNNSSSFKTDPALPVLRKSIIPPQSTAKDVSAAGSQQSAQNQDSAPFSPSPFGMQRREILNAENHGLLLYPHPFPARDYVCETLHNTSDRTAITKSNFFHNDPQTETGGHDTYGGFYTKPVKHGKGRGWRQAQWTNEQTEAVTPILRSGGQSLGKLNF